MNSHFDAHLLDMSDAPVVFRPVDTSLSNCTLFSGEELKWESMESLMFKHLPATPKAPAPRLSMYDKIDLSRIETNNLFPADGEKSRFSFYIPSISPPKCTSTFSLTVGSQCCPQSCIRSNSRSHS